MLTRLPYRLQIPLGLSLAVVLTALLVTAIASHFSTLRAGDNIMLTVSHASILIEAQALPLIAADDVWQAFRLMRATAALLPGAEVGQSRAALLDARGNIIAASDPATLPTAESLLGHATRGRLLPAAQDVKIPVNLLDNVHGLTIINPLHSEDGQTLGFAYIEVDTQAFAIDWFSIATPTAMGVGLAVSLLVPAGWWFGRRMTRPIELIAQTIDRIGTDVSEVQVDDLLYTADPELSRINAAVGRLIHETQLRKNVEQRAFAAERLAALGRMTAAVAHEINNPLGGLLNVTRTLESHGDCQKTRQSSLALLERGLDQIRSTVSALLPQARAESRPLSVTDFDDIVLLAKASIAGKSLEIHTDTDISVTLQVSAGPMRQVMLNLLSNACKAAEDGGYVHATLAADTNEVRFRVANSGCALSAELLERIVTAEAGADPQGFGLWVCREIATRYAGGFRVENTINGMTNLLFWIPNTDRDQTPVAH